MGIHFTKEEFAERKSKIIKELKNQNLDALLMFRQESMYWLTGYDTFGFVFFQCLVLTVKGDLVLLTRAPDLRQAQNTSVIDDIKIWVDKDKSNPADELKNILSELDLEKSNLGIEYEAYGLTGRNAIRLNNSLKNFATLHDKSELISHFRAIKSPSEIIPVVTPFLFFAINTPRFFLLNIFRADFIFEFSFTKGIDFPLYISSPTVFNFAPKLPLG